MKAISGNIMVFYFSLYILFVLGGFTVPPGGLYGELARLASALAALTILLVLFRFDVHRVILRLVSVVLLSSVLAGLILSCIDIVRAPAEGWVAEDYFIYVGFTSFWFLFESSIAYFLWRGEFFLGRFYRKPARKTGG